MGHRDREEELKEKKKKGRKNNNNNKEAIKGEENFIFMGALAVF